MKNDIPLLPCPFCGGKATLHKDTWPGEDGRFWTRCHKCGACCEEAKTAVKAAALWNRRTPHSHEGGGR